MGNIEDKLDQIIELLGRIDAKLSPTSEPEMPVTQVVIAPKPTNDMLKFQHMIELAASMDRTHLFSHIRKNAAEYMPTENATPTGALVLNHNLHPRSTSKYKRPARNFIKTLRPGTRTISASSNQKLNKYFNAPSPALLPVLKLLYFANLISK
jgi:hypothetical protein